MFIKFNNAIRTELQLAGKLPICVSKSVFSSICFLLPSPTSLCSVSIVYNTALHSSVKNWLQSINLSSMLEITLPKLRTTQSTIDIWVKNIFTTTIGMFMPAPSFLLSPFLPLLWPISQVNKVKQILLKYFKNPKDAKEKKNKW